jgi:hypothetical protein
MDRSSVHLALSAWTDWSLPEQRPFTLVNPKPQCLVALDSFKGVTDAECAIANRPAPRIEVPENDARQIAAAALNALCAIC